MRLIDDGRGNYRLPAPKNQTHSIEYWREMDSSRKQVGFRIWRTGGEVYVGKRLYRCRWSNR